MCDDDTHSTESLSRRAFGIAAAASVVFAAAVARAEEGVEETDVGVPTPDGSADAVVFRPRGTGPWPGVLIWPDILGLRPVFRQIGRRLAAQGYVVLVPNPFYRVRRAPVVEGPFSFTNPEDRAKVMPLAAALTPDGTRRDAMAFIAFLDDQPQVDAKAKAGVHGYCMGGSMALRTAAALPERIGAAATFHGAKLVTPDANSPHRAIASVKGSVYCAIAENDDRREPAAKGALEEALATARLPGQVEVYAGADHGWCVPDNAVYNEAAAERAWTALSALYKRSLV